MKFSQVEIKEILKAWFLVSLIFAIAFTGISLNLIIAIPIALLTAGVGFLLHELAHKFVAQHYKCWAEFRANNRALLLGLVISFFGFVLVAPGGVYIRGATPKQHGRIAYAGPVTNLFLGGIFYGLTYIVSGPLLTLIIFYGFKINALLGVFNLIPFPPFDGFSIWKWNKIMYLIAAAAGIGLMLL